MKNNIKVWAKRILISFLFLLGLIILLNKYYFPYKIKEYDEQVEKSTEALMSTGSVSATLVRGSDQYDPEIANYYLERQNYPKVFSLLKKKIEEENASIGDYLLMLRLLKSNKQIEISKKRKQELKSKYTSLVKSKYGDYPAVIIETASPTDTSIKKIQKLIDQAEGNEAKQEILKSELEFLKAKKEVSDYKKQIKEKDKLR